MICAAWIRTSRLGMKERIVAGTVPEPYDGAKAMTNSQGWGADSNPSALNLEATERYDERVR